MIVFVSDLISSDIVWFWRPRDTPYRISHSGRRCCNNRFVNN